MTPYDEQQVISFQRDVVNSYIEVGRDVDLANVVWTARMVYDAVTIGYSNSRSKHLSELKKELGLTNKIAVINHKPLPPFEHSDSGGDVHIVLPPEQVIPNSPDINWWRGDIAGVMLNETPPYVPGANTTPREMVMSFQLHLYDRTWQDKILTAHAERGYTHFHLLDAAPVDLFAYVQSFGFYTSFWSLNTDRLDELSRNNLSEKSVIVIGGEVNSKMSPELLMNFINKVQLYRPVKVGLHFTYNYPSWQLPSQSPFDWWNGLNGKVDFLCWQGNQDNSAGAMGAHLWDARVRVANNARVVAFELLATNQLYGRATEEQGCLRGWEMLCSTRVPNSNIPAVAGFGNGARYPDGTAI